MSGKMLKKECRPNPREATRVSRGARSDVRKAQPLSAKIFKVSPLPMGITKLATRGYYVETNVACLKIFAYHQNE